MKGSEQPARLLGDGRPRRALRTPGSDLGGIHGHARSAEPLALSLRITQPGVDALDDEGPFEFGDSAEHRKSHFPDRGARIDGLGIGHKFDPERAEGFKRP